MPKNLIGRLWNWNNKYYYKQFYNLRLFKKMEIYLEEYNKIVREYFIMLLDKIEER